jgi:hypothetical protein
MNKKRSSLASLLQCHPQLAADGVTKPWQLLNTRRSGDRVMPTASVYYATDSTESLKSKRFGNKEPRHQSFASLDRFGMGILRLGLVIVLAWIGGLEAGPDFDRMTVN